MKRFILALALLAAPILAHAQQATVVSTCNAVGYDAGPQRPVSQSTGGALCVVDSAATVAAGAADSGNPVKVGGVYNATPPALTDGNRGNAQLTAHGALRVELWGESANGPITVANSAIDGYSLFQYSIPVQSVTRLMVGTGPLTDVAREIVTGTDSTGTGIAGVGLIGQRDDTSPSSITENQFGNVRVGGQHQLLVQPPSPYPYSAIGGTTATPLSASSGNVANSAAAATLTGTATTTVYIAGLQCTPGGATAAALVSVTVTGTLGGTKTYTAGAPLGATIMGQPLVVTFTPPIPASAVNTAIVVSMPALGAGNTNAACSANGFYM